MSTFLNLSDAALRLVDDTAQAVLDSHTAPTAEALEAALEVVAACRIEREARNADQAFAADCQRVSVAPSAVELARKTVELARKIIAALDTERDNEERELAKARRGRLGARVWSQTKHGITAWEWTVAGASGTRATKAEAISAIDRIVDAILAEEA